MKKYQFIIGVIAGIFLAIIFFRGCNERKVEQPKILDKKQVEKVLESVNTIDTIYNKKVDSINLLLNDARSHIVWLKLNEKATDGNILLLRKKIGELIDNSTQVTGNDFEDGREQLYSQINNLNKANDLRDSLCDENVTALNQILEKKDTVISIKDSQIAFNKISFNELVNNNYKMNDLVGNQEKKINRLKSSFTIAPSFSAGYLLSSTIDFTKPAFMIGFSLQYSKLQIRIK